MINLSTCTHSLPLLFGCSLSPLPSSALIRSSSALAEASLHTPIDSTNAKITLNALLYIPRPLPITILYIYISYPLTVNDVLVFPCYTGGPFPRLFIQTVLLRRAALLLYLCYLPQERNVTVPSSSPVTVSTHCKEYLK